MTTATRLGVVLAGGQSSRMGTDKALLTWQGNTLLDHARSRLSDAGCDAVVISRNDSGGIADLYPDCGPLGGMHAVIKAHPQARGFLFLPVDMPAVSSDLLRQLLHDDHSTYYQDSVLPAWILNSPALLPELEQRLQQGEHRVHRLLHQLGAQPLSSHTPEHLINTNTPQEWQAFTQARPPC